MACLITRNEPGPFEDWPQLEQCGPYQNRTLFLEKSSGRDLLGRLWAGERADESVAEGRLQEDGLGDCDELEPGVSRASC